MEEEDIYDSKDDPDEPAPQTQNRSIWEGFLGDLAGREVILNLEADGVTLECGSLNLSQTEE